jgi:hypothetical protein
MRWLKLTLGFFAIVVSLCLLTTLLIVTIGLPDLYRQQRSIAALNPTQKRTYYAKRTPFYHLLPTAALPAKHESSVKERWVEWDRATELTHWMDEALLAKQRFMFHFRNVRICSGLPVFATNDAAAKLIIWHISGAWTGLFPTLPKLNGRFGGGHALPIRDVVSRHTFLDLPYPVVACKLPTDAVCALNFGGDDDQLVLTHIFESICRQNNNSAIVASADCLGGLRFIRWLRNYHGTYRNRLVGTVIEGPLSSMDRICRPSQSSKPLNDAISSLFAFALPNFDPNYTSVGKCHVPALIAVLEEDGLCGKQDVPWIRETFPQLYSLLVVPVGSVSQSGRLITHGNAYRWPPFRTTLLSFLSSLVSPSPSPSPSPIVSTKMSPLLPSLSLQLAN